ncbi:MAG: 1,4-dihydroxy-2-naphthoate octaprenyltransferase, partial [Duodenibacillus sp.]
NVWVALATLALSLLMQTISNMENDAGYTKRKAERATRKGLPRATANGWLSVPAVETMIKVLIGLVVLDTAYLIYVGGWVMSAISIASVAAAYSYMGGKKPIAYTPLSELMVYVFFGPVAVGGTYWLQTHTMTLTAFLAGSGLGLIAAAVLAVNNYRDIAHDAEVGRRTLAVLLGARKMERVYAGMLLGGFGCVLFLVAVNPALWGTLMALMAFPLALRLMRMLGRKQGLELNAVMFGTIKLEVIFAFLVTAGALLSLALPFLQGLCV